MVVILVAMQEGVLVEILVGEDLVVSSPGSDLG